MSTSPVRTHHGLVTLVGIGLATLPALLGGLVWDDGALVTHNPFVQGQEPPWGAIAEPLFEGDEALRRYYRPVLGLVLALVGQGIAPHPLAFHLLAWSLHLGAAALCLRWLSRRIPLAEDPELRHQRLWALCIATAWFALHPARAHSVAWISGLGDVLLCVFGLSAAVLLEPAPHGIRRASLFGVCCALAVGSKEAGVAVLPWLLLDQAVRGGRRALRERALALALGAAATATVLCARLFVELGELGDWTQGGLSGLASRVLVSLGFALRALMWPVTLHVQLDLPLSDWAHLPLRIAALAVPGALSLVALGALAWRARRRPSLRPWLADALTFFVLLGPTLNIVVIGTLGGSLAERYLALPSAGAAALLARGLTLLRGRARQAAQAVALAVALLFAFGLSREIRHFDGSVALFTHLAEQSPERPMPADHLQRIHLAAGRFEQARRWAVRRLRLSCEPQQRRSWAQGRHVNRPDDSQKARALLDFLQVELRGLADVEQARLRAIRRWLDAVARAEGEQASLIVGGRPVTLHTHKRVLSALEDAGVLDDLQLTRAHVHARTLDLPGARALLGELTPTPEVQALQLQLALWAGDDAQAERWLEVLGPQRTAHARAARRRLASATSPVDHAIALAAAGWPAGARAALDRLGLPSEHPARAEVDLLDGRPDLAVARLDRTPNPTPQTRALEARARQLLAHGRGLRVLTSPY